MKSEHAGDDKVVKQGIRNTIMKCIRRAKTCYVEITEATRFKEDLEVDSLDLFELVMAFEEEYGVSIPSEKLENMATVGDVIRYIQEQA